MKRISSLLLISSIGLSACAHEVMRGSVAMKINDQEGYVCLGDNEVKEGNKVALYKNDCTPLGTGQRVAVNYGPACKKLKVGEGEVTKLLNEHYSVIKTPPQVAIQEGMIVEVLKPR